MRLCVLIVVYGEMSYGVCVIVFVVCVCVVVVVE